MHFIMLLDEIIGLSILIWKVSIRFGYFYIKYLTGCRNNVMCYGCPYIHFLLWRSKYKQCDKLLNNGTDINYMYGGRATLLHVMVHYNKIDQVRYLLSRGANINCMDIAGDMPINLAIDNCDLDMIQLLINNNALEYEFIHNKHPLYHALGTRFNKRLEPYTDEIVMLIMEHMVTHSKSPEEVINIKIGGNPLLCGAVYMKCYPLIKYLIKHPAIDINVKNQYDNGTCLHQACIDNDLSLVKMLVEHGADKNITNNKGLKPIQLVCGFHHPYSMEDLPDTPIVRYLSGSDGRFTKAASKRY